MNFKHIEITHTVKSGDKEDFYITDIKGNYSLGIIVYVKGKYAYDPIYKSRVSQGEMEEILSIMKNLNDVKE